MSDAAEIQQLVREAWDEARSIDMRHLGEHDRALVWETIVDLIEAISPRLKTGLSCPRPPHGCERPSIPCSTMHSRAGCTAARTRRQSRYSSSCFRRNRLAFPTA